MPQRRDAEGFYYPYNLFFEVLINDARGSVLDYARNANGDAEVIREKAFDAKHNEIVRQVHAGARLFSRMVRGVCCD